MKIDIDKLPKHLADQVREYLDEPKVGKHWVTKGDNLIYISDNNKYSIDGTYIHAARFTYKTDFRLLKSNLKRKATPDEVEEFVTKAWEKICKDAGWDDWQEAEIKAHADGDTHRVNYGKFSVEFWLSNNSLWNKNGIVYTDGKFATPKKKQDITTWEEAFNKIQPRWYVDTCSYIEKHLNTKQVSKCTNRNQVPIKKHAKKILATCQLITIAYVMNEEDEFDWHSGELKYYNYFDNTKSKICQGATIDRNKGNIYFKTKELAQKCFENNKQLWADYFMVDVEELK